MGWQGGLYLVRGLSKLNALWKNQDKAFSTVGKRIHFFM